MLTRADGINFAKLSIIILLMGPPFCLGQQPAQNSEAALAGMRGPVHTVLTESTDYRDNPRGSPMWSVLAVYDSNGYALEEYRYEPSGALYSHKEYKRKAWRIFKEETTSVVPSENHTFVQHFNSGGLATGTEDYDGTGALLRKTHEEVPVKKGGATTLITETSNSDGTVTTDKTIWTVDRKTGISHESTTVDGKPLRNWVIEQAAKGNREAAMFKLKVLDPESDGSFNRRKVKPDGTIVEHRYTASSKTHTYQTTDPHGLVTEVIDASPESYTRTTYHYDQQGRLIELNNYDRSGKRFGEEINKYQDDEYGNCIEQREFDWSSDRRSRPMRLGIVTRRTITYY